MKKDRRLHINDELKPTFRNEVREEIDKLVEILLDQVRFPADADAVRRLLRITHNIKGLAAWMRLTEMMELVHRVENLLDQVHKSNQTLDSRQIDLLLKFSDDLVNYISSNDWSDLSELRRWHPIFPDASGRSSSSSMALESPLMLTGEERQQIAYWQHAGRAVYGITLTFQNGSLQDGDAVHSYLKEMDSFGLVFKTAPVVQDLAKANFQTFKAVLLTETPLAASSEQKLRSVIFPGIIRVDIRNWVFRKDDLELKTRIEHQAERTIRVETAKVEHLYESLQRLQMVKDELAGLAATMDSAPGDWRRWREILPNLDSVTLQIQHDINELRMVPLRSIFFRFPKLVHDLSLRKHKLAEMRFYGETIEIDKEIADKLIEPLTHLIFNAIDHGLETEEQRRNLGKSLTGQILLGVKREAKLVIIEVSDDGRGIDLGKVKAKALEDQLITPDAFITEADLLQFIFRPGFSTAEQLTELSGRGIGLDIVAGSIRALQGKVEVATKENQGTSFWLYLPASLTD